MSEQKAACVEEALTREHHVKQELAEQLDEVLLSASSSHGMHTMASSMARSNSEAPSSVVDDDDEFEPVTPLPRSSSMMDFSREISLMSELKMDFDGDAARLDELETSLVEAGERERDLEEEVADLRRQVAVLSSSSQPASSSTVQSDQEQLGELQAEYDRVFRELTEERRAKSKLEERLEEREKAMAAECSGLKADAAALQVKLDGLRTASEDQAKASRLQMTRLEEEIARLRLCEESALRDQATTTEQLKDKDRAVGRHTDELEHIRGELVAIRSDLEKLGRVVTSMGSSEVTTVLNSGGMVAGDDGESHDETAVQLLGIVREKVRILRGAVEVLVRRSLEKVMTAGGSNESTNLSDEEKKAFQLEVQQLQVQLTAKRQEVSTLRTVLKAHRSTAQAAVFRERSFGERQLRATESETADLRERIEKLRKDNAEFAQMRHDFGKR